MEAGGAPHRPPPLDFFMFFSGSARFTFEEKGEEKPKAERQFNFWPKI